MRHATFVCRQEGPTPAGITLTFSRGARPCERGGRTPHVSLRVASGPQLSPPTKEIQAAASTCAASLVRVNTAPVPSNPMAREFRRRLAHSLVGRRRRCGVVGGRVLLCWALGRLESRRDGTAAGTCRLPCVRDTPLAYFRTSSTEALEAWTQATSEMLRAGRTQCSRSSTQKAATSARIVTDPESWSLERRQIAVIPRCAECAERGFDN